MTEAVPTAIQMEADSAATPVHVYRCQKAWDELQATGHDDVRHCNQCNQSVYQVVDVDGFRRAVAQGRCVMVQGYQRGRNESATFVGKPGSTRHEVDG